MDKLETAVAGRKGKPTSPGHLQQCGVGRKDEVEAVSLANSVPAIWLGLEGRGHLKNRVPIFGGIEP